MKNKGTGIIVGIVAAFVLLIVQNICKLIYIEVLFLKRHKSYECLDI